MERWYRRFLSGVAAMIFAVTPIELLLLDHTGSVLQYAPFIGCAAGLAAALIAFRGPTSIRGIRISRWISYAVFALALYGMLEHVLHNLELEQEVRPDTPILTMLWRSVSGAAPFLASGILSLGALLTWASLKQLGSHPSRY